MLHTGQMGRQTSDAVRYATLFSVCSSLATCSLQTRLFSAGSDVNRMLDRRGGSPPGSSLCNVSTGTTCSFGRCSNGLWDNHQQCDVNGNCECKEGYAYDGKACISTTCSRPPPAAAIPCLKATRKTCPLISPEGTAAV